jgi:hypothetical protein
MLVLIKNDNLTLLIEIDGAIFRGYDLRRGLGKALLIYCNKRRKMSQLIKLQLSQFWTIFIVLPFI